MSILLSRVRDAARTTLRCLDAEPRCEDVASSIDDALFACALARTDDTVSAEPFVARALASVRGRRVHPALFGGLSGLGFVLSSYGHDASILDAVDDSVRATVPRLPAGSLQGGVAGVALYACLRSHTESGQRLQAAALDALSSAAIASRGGVLWPTPPAYARARGLPESARLVELGMVHGVGGAVAALASLAARGHTRAGELARSALAAISAWQRSGPNRFARVELGVDGGDGELDADPRRWCVGDPGVIRACWLAANAVGDLVVAERALALLRESATLDLEGDLPGAPGQFDLCCGTAAIAQLYTRMRRETGEPVFAAAERRLATALVEKLESLPPRGILQGRPGVLLALLACLTDVEPTWDAMLGFSLPKATA